MLTISEALHIERQINQALEQDKIEEAKKIAGDLDPENIGNIKILNICGNLFRQTGNLEKALEFSSSAHTFEPENLATIIQHVSDLIKMDRLDEAEDTLNNVTKKLRDNPNINYYKAKVETLQGNFENSNKILKKVISKNKDYAAAHLDLAHGLLMLGQWKEGWKEYSWRYRLPKTENMYPRFKMPAWDGGENEEHLLVIADQGYGDCFQFARYLPLAAERCKKLTLMRSEPLARMFDSMDCISESYTKWEETPLTSSYAMLSDLPGIFSRDIKDIPDCTNIFSIKEENVNQWKEKLNEHKPDAKLRVGLTWSGRVEFQDNYLRATSFETMKPLLKNEDTQFYSLQVGPTALTAIPEEEQKNIVDLSSELTDFYETASAMEALDLVITTDTSIAHLAGTLGKPCWVLLAYVPDWRWGFQGSTSPWYQNMRLIRQNKQKDWGKVIAGCEKLLQEITEADNPDEALKASVTS